MYVAEFVAVSVSIHCALGSIIDVGYPQMRSHGACVKLTPRLLGLDKYVYNPKPCSEF